MVLKVSNMCLGVTADNAPASKLDGPGFAPDLD